MIDAFLYPLLVGGPIIGVAMGALILHSVAMKNYRGR